MPGYSNWTVRASLRAGRAIRRENGQAPLDALFVHTQVPAVLNTDRFRGIPRVVSLDATPLQYDELGDVYGHESGSDRLERLKHALNTRCYQRADRLVTWAEWTKAGLVADYGVDPADVEVIPPGVDPQKWWFPPRTGTTDDSEPVRVLFVGADLRRKGGFDLVEAVREVRRRLTESGSPAELELHVVTTAELSPEPGVFVHRGLTPNSPELIDQYRRADIFCLPTYGDCLPMVLSEAGAAGLPLVATDVGAISEIVHDEKTGRLVRPGAIGELADALVDLAENRERARRLGSAACELVRERYDAAKNARRIVDVMLNIGKRRR
ncbi:MAG: glycosyltransferase family 4 protein [Ilumatobacter sp.]